MEISYHYKVLLVDNFLPLKIELTVYISYPNVFPGNLSDNISYHNRLNFILLLCMHFASIK
jgi:hypothetical protein